MLLGVPDGVVLLHHLVTGHLQLVVAPVGQLLARELERRPARLVNQTHLVGGGGRKWGSQDTGQVGYGIRWAMKGQVEKYYARCGVGN